MQDLECPRARSEKVVYVYVIGIPLPLASPQQKDSLEVLGKRIHMGFFRPIFSMRAWYLGSVQRFSKTKSPFTVAR